MANDSEIYFLMPQQFISVLKEIYRASFLTGKSELMVVLFHTLIMKTAVISPFVSNFNGCT